MRGKMGFSACLVLLALLPSALCLNNGLALTPTMGFNTWNAFGSDISEQLVLQTAAFMRNMSLVQLGYNLIVLDGVFAKRSPLLNDLLTSGTTFDGRLVSRAWQSEPFLLRQFWD